MGNAEPCVLDPALEEILASVDLDEFSDASASDVVKPVASEESMAKSPVLARSRRREILDLRQEIEALECEIESIRTDQLLNIDSLDQFVNPSHGLRPWRSIATSERLASDRAQEANVLLKKQLRKNLKLVNRLKGVLDKQATRFHITRQIAITQSLRSIRVANASLDNMRVWKMLQLSVEKRYHDLDELLVQSLPSGMPGMQPEVVKHADGAGVDYKTTAVLPFPVAVVASVLCRVSGMDAVLKSDSNDQITFAQKKSMSVQLGVKESSDQIELGRFVLRRIVEPQRTVLLWESMDAWVHPEERCETPGVHGASWSVIQSAPEFGPSASFLQGSFSFRIRGCEDKLQMQELLSRLIQRLQRFYLDHRDRGANLLMDAMLSKRWFEFRNWVEEQMLIRSYASDPSASPAWVAFIRQQQPSAFTFTVLVTRSAGSDHDSCSSWAFERVMEASDLEDHIEELGLQIEVSSFVDLLLKTLESRACVDIEVKVEQQEEGKTAPEASLMLTYKFSDTISRKGIMALQLIATNPPEQVLSLLMALHGSPNKPILSEVQKARSFTEKETIRATTAMAPSMISSMVSGTNAGNKSAAPAGAETQETTTSAAASALSKKRRLVPSGAVRRKGPRGAILARPSK